MIKHKIIKNITPPPITTCDMTHLIKPLTKQDNNFTFFEASTKKIITLPNPSLDELSNYKNHFSVYESFAFSSHHAHFDLDCYDCKTHKDHEPVTKEVKIKIYRVFVNFFAQFSSNIKVAVYHNKCNLHVYTNFPVSIFAVSELKDQVLLFFIENDIKILDVYVFDRPHSITLPGSTKDNITHYKFLKGSPKNIFLSNNPVPFYEIKDLEICKKVDLISKKVIASFYFKTKNSQENLIENLKSCMDNQETQFYHIVHSVNAELVLKTKTINFDTKFVDCDITMYDGGSENYPRNNFKLAMYLNSHLRPQFSTPFTNMGFEEIRTGLADICIESGLAVIQNEKLLSASAIDDNVSKFISEKMGRLSFFFILFMCKFFGKDKEKFLNFIFQIAYSTRNPVAMKVVQTFVNVPKFLERQLSYIDSKKFLNLCTLWLYNQINLRPFPPLDIQGNESRIKNEIRRFVNARLSQSFSYTKCNEKCKKN